KRVVVVVPALAHRDERGERDVASLYRRPVDSVMHAALVVGEVTDQPVAEHAGAHARAGTPEHVSPSTPQVEGERPRQLLNHPGTLEKPVEPVFGDTRLDGDSGRSGEPQVTVELPPGVEPEVLAVAQIIVAIRQSLRVVAQLVL